MTAPDFEQMDSLETVRQRIRECEGHHVQQVCYSTYHDALTQVCFTERKVRSNAPFPELAAEPSHPEATCERCGRPNVWSWSAPSPLWNAVLRDPVTRIDRYSVVCPPCFAELAEESGAVPAGRTTWRFYPDHPANLAALWPAEPGYAWDNERWLWVEAVND